MGIYTGNSYNLDSALANAIKNHNATSQRESERRAQMAKEFNKMVKAIAKDYATQQDDPEEKLKALKEEEAKAIEDRNAEILTAYANAQEAQKEMEGYRPDYSVPNYWDAMQASALMNNYRPNLLRQPAPENMPMTASFNSHSRYAQPLLGDYDKVINGGLY